MRFAAVVLALVLAGARTAKAEEVIHPQFDDLDRGENREETYQLNALGILKQELVAASPNVIVVNGKSWYPRRGKYQKELTFEQFYRILGRPDLERRWVVKKWAGVTSAGVGIGSLIGGVMLFWRGASLDGITTSGKIGAAMVGFGILTSIIASGVLRPPTDDLAAVEMAVRYNDALRVRLDLPPIEPP
jgi:hypothetical protein